MEINKIYNEDCLEGMKRIQEKSIDMILCDLPYGTTACKWDSIIPMELLWENYNRIIKDRGVIILTATQPFASQLINANIKNFKYDLIWDKMIGGAFVLAKKRPLPKHEHILIFYKNAPIYNPQMTEAIPKNMRPTNKGSSQGNAVPVAGGLAKSEKDYNPNKRYPTSILNYSSKMAECNSLHRIHPTQKPIAMFEWLIKTYTNEGETVLDNCIGSGTTAIACIKTKRNFIGFELDENYCKIANERIASL